MKDMMLQVPGAHSSKQLTAAEVHGFLLPVRVAEHLVVVVRGRLVVHVPHDRVRVLVPVHLVRHVDYHLQGYGGSKLDFTLGSKFYGAYGLIGNGTSKCLYRRVPEWKPQVGIA